MQDLWKQTVLPTLSLFTSVGTLVCCALPALLVTLGMGAALAGLVSNAGWLVVLSEHKVAVFGVAGAMLLITAILRWKGRSAPCPADPAAAKACMRMRKVSAWLYWFSVVVYAVGFFFAFVAVKVFY